MEKYLKTILYNYLTLQRKIDALRVGRGPGTKTQVFQLNANSINNNT